MSALITAAVIGITGAFVSANQKKVAANKAKDAQQAALDKQQQLDPAAIAAQAYQQDLQKYKQQFEALNQVDPVTGQIRQVADEGLLANAKGDANSTNANTLLQNLFKSNSTVSPTDANFEATLKSKAQGLLDLGGKLSPDAQAEFVRAGLEKAGQSGFNPASGATVNGVGKLLFTESNALEQQRAAMAKDLFGFATDLNSTRNAQMLNIASASSGKSVQDYQKLMGLAQLSDSRVPNLGLTGANVANLNVANIDQKNQLATMQGAVNAADAQARGAITAGLIGGITSSVTGALGAYASGGSGLGSFASLSKDAVNTTPYTMPAFTTTARRV